MLEFRPRPVELCEWDPVRGASAAENRARGERWGCDRPATTSVGVRENWHLCDQCAALPRFARMRSRVRLDRKK